MCKQCGRKVLVAGLFILEVASARVCKGSSNQTACMTLLENLKQHSVAQALPLWLWSSSISFCSRVSP